MSQRKSQGKRDLDSTVSLGKRRSLKRRKSASNKKEQQQDNQMAPDDNDPRGQYGSQATAMKIQSNTSEPVKVAILGAAGGIGQPLAMLLMLHSEYIQHLALYDLVQVPGVVADVSHIDRQCKVTGHMGPDELAEAVKGAKVIVIPAGLAQKPGMSRDDLFGSNAKIVYNLVKVCAVAAPDAMLAIISNPVNSLVPLVCEVYQKICSSKQPPLSPQDHHQTTTKPQQDPPTVGKSPEGKSETIAKSNTTKAFHECCRRIFGVTTLDVVRASTLTAKSGFCKPEPNGLFKDPSKITVPVVGGHAGKTILPLLSQASPRIDKKRLVDDKATTQALIEAVQNAGIDVLNAKKGKGSATLAMAYAACRFTISLLRAIQGEPNIIECAYVRQQQPVVPDLDYFATPLLIGKSGYVKSMGLGKNLLPFEQQMIEEACKELRLSVARGEDFAREQLSSEKN